jgi:dTDP-glucose 4,6-dehydratase
MDLNYLVTGGLGFIGSNFLIRLLKKKNIKVYSLDFEKYSSNLKLLKILKKKRNFFHKKIDISNFTNLKKYFYKAKPNILVNFAAETHVDNSIKFSKKFIDSNIIGTYNLLECSRLYLQNNNKKKFKFIQISTDEVYGDIEIKKKNKFNENSQLNPSSPYSASKASADLLVKSWTRTYGLPTIITRSANNYGPFQNKEKLIPKTILNIINRKKIPIYGKGVNIRNWVFVQDNVDAIMTVISKGVIGQTYNIGGKNELSNLEIVKLICHEISKKIKDYSYIQNLNLINFVTDRPGHDEKYSLNIKKLKKLNWNEKVNLKKGINKTINWYLEKKNEI